jgi:small GTP-binding protein
MKSSKITLKLGFLGDSSVGKTTICLRLLNMDFSENTILTIGNDQLETKFKLKDGNVIKVILWDTAGQERFHSAALRILKVVQGIILIFDITNKKSFENINNWLNEIKENFENPCIILFGNKVDVEKDKWQITKEEIEEFSKKMNLTYFETSAKTNVGINEGFSYIINYIYDQLIQNQVIENDVIVNNDNFLNRYNSFQIQKIKKKNDNKDKKCGCAGKKK